MSKEMFKLFQTLSLAPFGLLLFVMPWECVFFIIINIIINIMNTACSIITIILCGNDNNNPFVCTH